jgi:hypothetical protein
MLAVDQRLLAGRARRFDGVAQALEVLLVGDAERHAHVIVPGLGDEAHRLAAGAQQVLQAGIVGGRAPRPLGHAEGGERGLERRRIGEELAVGRVGAGIAALDVVEPEFVEHPRDHPLVLDRKIHPRRLLPVPQRRVVEIEALARLHRPAPLPLGGEPAPDLRGRGWGSKFSRHDSIVLKSRRTAAAR